MSVMSFVDLVTQIVFETRHLRPPPHQLQLQLQLPALLVYHLAFDGNLKFANEQFPSTKVR